MHTVTKALWLKSVTAQSQVADVVMQEQATVNGMGNFDCAWGSTANARFANHFLHSGSKAATCPLVCSRPTYNTARQGRAGRASMLARSVVGI